MHNEIKAIPVKEANDRYAGRLLGSPVVGGVIAMWVDLVFPARLVLGGIHDEVVIRYYETVVKDSWVQSHLPSMVESYFVFGRFVAQLLEDVQKGHWTDCVEHNLDYCSIQIVPDQYEPRITLTPTKQQIACANSTDPKMRELTKNVDPNVIRAMAKGDDIALDPVNTLFMARHSHASDYYGTSWLEGIDPNTMSTAEVLLRLRVDVSKLRDERAFNAHYVEAAYRLRDHITAYIFTQKMFPHIAAAHGYGKLIPTVTWLPVEGAESPRNIVLRTLEDLRVPLAELEEQQRALSPLDRLA